MSAKVLHYARKVGELSDLLIIEYMYIDDDYFTKKE